MPEGAGMIGVGMMLEGTGSQILTESEAVVDLLEQLKTMLAPIITDWQGSAQVNWEGVQNEWNIASDGLFGPTGVLGRVASAVNLSWNNYSDCEWANVRTWLPAGVTPQK